MVQLLKSLAPILYFLVELSMLAGLTYAGFQSSRSGVVKYILAVGLPLVAAILWAVLAAPRSAHRLEPVSRAVFAITLFMGTAFLLYQTGHSRLALGFGVIALLSQFLLLVFKL